PTPSIAPDEREGHPGMPKVLVVDDSVSVRKVVERTLVAKQIDVLSAASGREATEQIVREKPDLIVCDVIMPDMDGYQLCEFVKTHPELGQTPVLLISGIVNSMVLERASAVGSDELMRKPFTPEELSSKVDKLLEGARTFVSTEPAEPALSIVASPAPQLPVASPVEALASAPDLKSVLGKLAVLPAVVLSVLVDREGFLIESA